MAKVAQARPMLQAFGADEGSIFFDSRTGRASSLILRQPLIPGSGFGNNLSWKSAAAHGTDAALGAEAWTALRQYLQVHQRDLHLDMSEISESPRIGIYDQGTLIFIYAGRVVDGIPVRDNSIGAAIKHGNLVLLGLQKWADINVARTPGVSSATAEAAVATHVRPFAITRTLGAARLELIPMSSGETITYRLAWVVTAKVDDDMGTWEGLVDAANGTLFAFEDRNAYLDGQVTGGVYPLANDQRPPDGVEQTDWPMPFVDYTIDGEKQYTDVGGNFGCIPGSISTALAGRYLKMADGCGAINEVGISGIDLGSGPTPTATDCTVPPGHSAGDTKASRTGYYELNRQIEKGLGHLPSPSDPAHIWMNQQLTSNMNINDTCNAFWNGASVNFFRSGGGCRNTGEIAAIFDHEWGHGLDNNGVNPALPQPIESIPDMYAMVRLNTSCIGRGFFTNQTCGGYGDACDGTPASGGCTGVRDLDYEAHRCNQPHTATWAQFGFTSAQCGGTGAATGCPPGPSPCGGEVHCEGYVMAEVGWDLLKRDLMAPPFNYDEQRAHEIGARLIYLGAQPITSWYTCAVGGGCGATGGYLTFLAVDDDNGNLSDGTPHMTAIRAAFERHEIHCATPSPVNSGCAGGPVDAPEVTLSGTDRAILVSWTAVDNASNYIVYRGDGLDGCNIGKAIIATTSELSFLDAGLANGRTYSYSVVPVGSNPACFGPMSACAQAEPIAGANLAFAGASSLSAGDGDPFLDNCELATISFAVNNSGIGDLTNVRIVGVTAVTHPLSTIVTAFPSTIAATMASCTVAGGSFQVIPQGLAVGGQAQFLVEIGADELGAETRTKLITLGPTESDLVPAATQTFSFAAGREGWTTLSGTFNRILGAGANGTTTHMSSSSDTDDVCDIVRSPTLVLSPTSTLSMWVRYNIEPFDGSDYWDRANVGVVDAVSGDRTLVIPDGGRVYDVPDNSPNGACVTAGQAGWDGSTPGFPTGFYLATWSAGALHSADLASSPAYLQISYGTDEILALKGFDFDEVTLTNFYVVTPDSHSDDCALATQVGPAGLAVDGAGNGVLEAGEVAVVSPTWANTGLNVVALNGTASAFGGPVGPTAPTYDLIDASGSYATLNPSQSAACSDCYGVSITAATRPATHWDATLTESLDSATLQQGAPLPTQKIWTLHVGGSFTDVASGNFYPYIETVLHNNVTAGCGDGTTFCPSNPVTRQEMAVFLLKAFESPGYAPPACITPAFVDVPCSSLFGPWINELVARDITAGCGDGTTFCPSDPVTREQMAVLLLKTFEGSGYVPPTCTTATFGDVPCSSLFAPWIYELVARGITAGCGGGNYCAGNPIARQEMAVFLVKTFGLTLYGP